MTAISSPARSVDFVVTQLFDNLRSGVVITAVVTIAVAVALAHAPLGNPSIGSVWLSGWCFLMLGVLGVRMALLYAYERTDEEERDSYRMWRHFRVLAILTGLCWGVLGMMAIQSAPLVATLTLLVIGAITVAAIPYLASDFPTYVGYLVASLTPVLVGAIVHWTPTSLTIGLFVILYCIGVWNAAAQYSGMLADLIELQSDAKVLNAKLTCYNQQLQDELEHRNEVNRQLQQARHAAESSNRSKTTFLSRMSHELRTPLNAILGFSELLHMMSEDEYRDKRMTYLEKVKKSGQHLLSLIEDILDIAKIDDGNIRFLEQQVDIREIVDECETMLETQLAENKIRIVRESTGSLRIESDRLRLRQILLNLMSNAIKYNRPHGTVTIRYAKAANNTVNIQVEDTGIGMPEDRLSEVFDPFVRLLDSSSSVSGTGIGLSITKQLVELMGGSIGIDTTIGKGTTMKIRLPRSLTETTALQATGT